ncbi:hypothetical protein EDB80DRAFT_571700 [Ilyonectria destructans]|nr:hypothetical protein EDB80DRAFT_571700 [Ilyonectria destructans]
MPAHEETVASLGPSLDRFQDLPDLRNAEDDWTGVTSTAQRRRLQNRLNQRAWRRRQKPDRLQATGLCDTSTILPNQLQEGLFAVEEVLIGAKQQTNGNAKDFPIYAKGLSLITKAHEMVFLRGFLGLAYEEYTLHAPRPSSLPLLIRINLLNALACNATKLSISPDGLCCADLISPFNLLGPSLPDNSQLSSTDYPSALQPTSLQRSVVHHPWIDLLPFATLRDNLLQFIALGMLDDDELCCDILGLHEGDLSESPAMIVWGEASDCNSWEVNPAFLRKWGWVVRGCPRIIEATNKWRINRGEKPIVFEG